MAVPVSIHPQYESAFSKPDPMFNMETLADFFPVATINEEEGGDEEEEERGEGMEEGEGSEEEREECREIRENENEDQIINNRDDPKGTVEPKLPQLGNVHFDYMDISHAIDQLSLYSGPGPDGVSAIKEVQINTVPHAV